MAVDGGTQNEDKAHAKSYSLFLSLLKWGSILTAIVTFIVVLLIAE